MENSFSDLKVRVDLDFYAKTLTLNCNSKEFLKLKEVSDQLQVEFPNGIEEFDREDGTTDIVGSYFHVNDMERFTKGIEVIAIYYGVYPFQALRRYKAWREELFFCTTAFDINELKFVGSSLKSSRQYEDKSQTIS